MYIVPVSQIDSKNILRMFSDQIAEQRLHRQKELAFLRTLRFIWTNSI